MGDISKIKIGDTEYSIKDETARKAIPTKISDLENDKKFITAENLPEAGNTELQELKVIETNTTYTIADSSFFVDNTSTIPYAFFENKDLFVKFAETNEYFIFAKCTNGFVIINGGLACYYVPFSATASSQAKKVTGLSNYVASFVNGQRVVASDTLIIFNYGANVTTISSVEMQQHLNTSSINDTFEKFTLGFSRDTTNTTAKLYYAIFAEQTTVKKPLANKYISIIGDSISTYSGYIPSGYNTHYPNTNSGITSVDKTWWKMLCDETDMNLLVNASYSGSYVTGDSTSTTSALSACSNKRIADLASGTRTPDIVLCYIGINDFGQNVHRSLGEYTGKTVVPAEGTIETLSEAYGLMISKIMTAYPNAKVYCCSLLEASTTNWDTGGNGQFPTINNNGVTVAEFNERIEVLAKAFGAGFIDLHSCGINYFNLSTYTHDGLHPNLAGATMIKNAIKSALNNDFNY